MNRMMKKAWMIVLAVLLVFAAAAAAEELVSVTGIKPAVNKITVMTGDTAEPVSVSVLPDKATNKTLLWSSEDETIATVDQDGAVTGVKAGKTRITVTAEDTSKGTRKAMLNVEVIQPVKTISTDITEVKIGIGARAKAAAAIAPEDATNKKLTWTSSDVKIAQVSPNGDITSRGAGEAVITCEAADGSGVKATIQVTVFQPVQSLRMDKKNLNAFAGKTSEALQVTVLPENAEYKDYTWTSSDETIATVNEKGEVTGIKGGRVQITATSAEPVTGNVKPKSVSCQVTVTQAVEYIALEKDEDRSTNKKLVLKVVVLPETATNKALVWTTSNKKIATVQNGTAKIKKKEGTATITATAKDGSGIYASCDINVGFAGTIISVGGWERRWGTYTWDVNNFTGNGTPPAADD